MQWRELFLRIEALCLCWDWQLLFICLSIDFVQLLGTLTLTKVHELTNKLFWSSISSIMVAEKRVQVSSRYHINRCVIYIVYSPRCVCWPVSSPLLWSACSCRTWTWAPCCTWRPPVGSCRRWSPAVGSIPGDSGGWGKIGRLMKKPETARTANSNSSTHTNCQDRNNICQIIESHKISLFQGRNIHFSIFWISKYTSLFHLNLNVIFVSGSREACLSA